MKSPGRDCEILFEDDHLIAAVKPSGLPTANAPRGTASLFTLLQARGPAGAFLGIVSRLDAPVSGVVVVAKTRTAAAGLAEQFRERTVDKSYSAVVSGRFPAPLGQWVDWHDAISREEGERRSEIHQGPDVDADAASQRPAHARARVVRRAGEVSLVELEPSTGRRHQLRVQLASRGCPIVGDRMYGSRLPCPAGGLALHATRLAIDHPASGRRMAFEAPCAGPWRMVFPSLFTGRSSG
ncbi:MAG: RluA family pseudouridine synthase [Planctomycetia bacterium]|nr:RluA family pseudouridine synthase [Planctomycetia bacterium]